MKVAIEGASVSSPTGGSAAPERLWQSLASTEALASKRTARGRSAHEHDGETTVPMRALRRRARLGTALSNDQLKDF